MFTGIIEEMGTVVSVQRTNSSLLLNIQGEVVLQDIHVGDSIAVNGVCLTVTAFEDRNFTADVMPETFRRSSLAGLSTGSRVNLERAMAADGRFGGHIVSGHVDGVGTISEKKTEDNAVWVTVTAGQEILHYVVEKGSIAIDGISLTVAYVDESCFKVSVIPHTGAQTTLLTKKKGEVVNLECDIIGKYVEKLLGQGRSQTEEKSHITMDFLSRHGFS